MFPIPSHLPRMNGNDHTDQKKDSGASSSAQAPVEVEKDRVLDLFGPLLGDVSALSVRQAKGVRETFESAIQENKRVSHDLLISNYPSISSHIRSGSEIRANLKDVQRKVAQLEGEVDPTNPETSFIPPVLSLLQRHFAAAQNRIRAQRHVAALKVLATRVEQVNQLEEAVYAGRGADEWVVDQLDGKEGYQLNGGSGDVLRGTRIAQSLEARTKLLRSMVVEQVTDGFAKAVAISTQGGGVEHQGTILVVQSKTSLQIPRIPRPGSTDKSTTSVPPPYSLTQIYAVLHRLNALSERLDSLRTRLLREVLQHLVTSEWSLVETRADGSSSLRLESGAPNSSAVVLRDVAASLDFIADHVFPPNNLVATERTKFIASLQLSTSQLILDRLLKSSIPFSLSALPPWLDTLHSAVDFEAAFDIAQPVIKPFFETDAGSEWARQRQRKVVEEVRRLITSGWGGWEAREEQREKEVKVVVEVEVEVDDEMEVDDAHKTSQIETAKEGTGGGEGDNFGWGFDDSPTASTKTQIPPPQPQPASTSEAIEVDVDDGNDGWGFDDAEAGPSKPTVQDSPTKPTSDATNDAEDGWAFDEDLTPAPVAPPVVIAKPAREAKKLGKRVAKAKTEDADSGSESFRTKSPSRARNRDPTPPRADPVHAPETAVETADDWGWNEEPAGKSAPSMSSAKSAKPKRKEFREEKRTIKETYLVSRACEKLLDTAERILREARDLERSLPSPSFIAAPPILYSSITTVFDVYRALLPAHFHTQLESVPTLSMQVYNDSLLLSQRLAILASTYAFDAEDIIRRLRENGEAIFEHQIELQRDGLVGKLDDVELEGLGNEVVFNRSVERLKEVERDLDSLARVLKTVLPLTTYLAIVGYLVDLTISHVSHAILSQRDITEVESNRLNELLQVLHPLESLFVLQPDQPSSVVEHVPHWLKFCYISELLTANLVDITYLFDTGALVDFTTDELVGMLKALFADSDKREKAIERIERGAAGEGTSAA